MFNRRNTITRNTTTKRTSLAVAIFSLAVLFFCSAGLSTTTLQLGGTASSPRAVATKHRTPRGTQVKRVRQGCKIHYYRLMNGKWVYIGYNYDPWCKSKAKQKRA